MKNRLMTKMNLFDRKPSLVSLLKVPFENTPFLAALIGIQKVTDALIPAAYVLVTARFINAAIEAVVSQRGLADPGRLYGSLFLIVLVLAFQMVFGAVTGYFIRKMTITLNNRIGRECMERQAALAYEYLDRQETVIKIKKVMGDLPGIINTLFGDALSIAAMGVRFFSIMLVCASGGLWWIGLLFLAVSAPMVLITYRTGKNVYRFYRENFAGELEMYHSTWILKNRPTSDERTLFGYSNAINENWKRMQYALHRKKLKINNKILANRYAARFLNLFCALCVITVMTFQVIEQNMTVGLYIALITAIIALSDQITGGVMDWINNLAMEKEFLNDFNDVRGYTVHPDAQAEPADTAFTLERLEFRDVGFRYPGTDRAVLEHCSFTLAGGKKYGFVGKNGAGKSTIIKLITKTYEDYTGDIFLNGKNLRDYSHAALKACIGIIYQDFARYELSMRDSIEIGDINRFHRPGADKKLEGLVKDLGLADLASSLPKGLDTHIGKLEAEGQDISGGEWQRIAIARLLMKNSDFLILDEPTAALDPLAESALYDQFAAISRDKTAVLISHRLGSIKTVDHILVIDGGRVAEEGSYEELMRQDGLFACMYNEQKGWYQ